MAKRLESITWTDCGISSKCPRKTLSTCFVWFVFVVLTCSDPESSSLLDRCIILRCGPTHNLQRNMMSSLSQSTYRKYSISQCCADEWGHVRRSPTRGCAIRLNQVIALSQTLEQQLLQAKNIQQWSACGGRNSSHLGSMSLLKWRKSS